MVLKRTLSRIGLSERDDLILKLIDSDITDIQNGNEGVEWLKRILKNGWKGYDSFSMKELTKEFEGRCLPE